MLFKFGALASVQHRGEASVMASSSETEDKKRFFTGLYAKISEVGAIDLNSTQNISLNFVGRSSVGPGCILGA